MLIIEAIGGALATFVIVDGYASLVKSMSRIHVADWRTGAGSDGVHLSPSIFHLND